MPMFGVMREIFEDDEASMRGVEDFFSVARTMPFVAVMSVSLKRSACPSRRLRTLDS